MIDERFKPTADWPLQENYKRGLHERIQAWGLRVAPHLEALPDDERQPREALFELLMTSVERGDRRLADTVRDLDNAARADLEGPGVYGRGGGSIDSVAGVAYCQQQFENLFAVYQAGAQQQL